MKGAFEYALLMLVGIPLICVLISFAEVALTLNQARVLQESVVAIIEHQHRYDASVAQLIEAQQATCPPCRVSVERTDLRYQVSVRVPLRLRWIPLERTGTLTTYTYYIP
ncbi:MAG: hypothetical protein ACRDBX_04950 [Erysipelotrichaceae bacterium]